MKLFLGVDPGSVRLGYAVLAVNERLEMGVVELGVIENSQLSSYERLGFIHQKISKLVGQYSFEGAAVEKVFLGKNPQSVFRLGLARGAALAALAEEKTPIYEYAPKYMKKYVTGRGDASKKQVLLAVKRVLKIEGEVGYDAADAAGLAYVLVRQFIADQRTNQFVAPVKE